VAYIKRSRSRGKEYRQIVESYRADGKVKQRVLVHLPIGAESAEHGAEICEGLAQRYRHYAESVERDTTNPFTMGHSIWRKAALRRAEEYTHKAEKNEAKAKIIRGLLESGKIAPDSEEVKAEREEALRRRWEIVAQWR